MHNLPRAAFIAASLLSFQADATETPELKDVAQLVQNVKRATGHQTGTAIAVVKDGKVVYQGYFGYADIEKKRAVSRQTAFYLASATKPFLALNVLLQESQGRLDTKRTLQSLFPKIAFRDFDANIISIRDLLTHRSGIDNQPLVWATAFSGIHSADSRYALVAQSVPDPETPYGSFRYTNVGYNIVSVWLDRQFNQPWQKQLQTNIFRPLGMGHTSAYIGEANAKHWQLAKPYSIISVDRNQALYLEKSDQTMQAAGGMVATAPDLAKFLIAELGAGKQGHRQVLSRLAINRSLRAQTKTDGQGYEDFKRDSYAWGWYVGEYKGWQMLHHFGSFAGFHAHLSMIPKAGIGLVVLNNEDFLAAKVTNLIADYVYGVLLGEADVHTKVSVRFDALIEKAKGLDAAIVSEQQKLRERPWKLSLPRDAYVGRYANSLLGDIDVSLNPSGEPYLTWGRLRAVATAYETQDAMRVEFVPNSGQVIDFVLTANQVTSIKFEGMTFERVKLE